MMGKRTLKISLLLIGAILTVFMFLNPVSAGDFWDQFRGDNKNSGLSDSDGIPTDQLLWKFETEGGIESSPLVSNGNVVFGSLDGNIYCLDEISGKQKWVFPTGGDISSSPLVVGAKLYLGSGDGSIYCINIEYGLEQWHFNDTGGGILSSPKYYKDKLFFGCDDGKVYCLWEDNGTENWNYSISGKVSQVWSSPGINAGLLYIGDHYGVLVCLDAETGEYLYNITTPGDVYTSVCFAGSDIIYANGFGGKLFRYNGKTGEKVWEFTYEDHSYTSVAIRDGKVYTSDYLHVYCLPLDDPDENGIISPGEVIWKSKQIDNFEGGSSPLLLNNYVVIGTGRNVSCYDNTTGERIWIFDTEKFVVSSPVYVDHKLIFTSKDGFIYCLSGRAPDAVETEQQDDDEFQLYPTITIPIIIFLILNLIVFIAIVKVWKKRRMENED